jgi:FlaA1/EpsC-like NDP-sugar epimerase
MRFEFPKVAAKAVLCDVQDETRVLEIFDRERPHIVFHAAAHKHVPLMESNPGEAIKNNVFGTVNVAQAADRFHCESFVFVSTDKAVNPTSIMGTTKRVAEIYIRALSKASETKYVAVRFGNVLGSTGSVIPIFKDQIKRGGPVTVTHPDMMRYFMTIPEASQLVMQAGAMGEGGEIFVLDMGEPVRIVDLAYDLIRLSGFEPEQDIKVEFIGKRPGEKLFEELAFDQEKMDKTRHPKIYTGRLTPQSLSEVTQELNRLSQLVGEPDRNKVSRALKKLVPEMIDERHEMRTKTGEIGAIASLKVVDVTATS